MKYILAFVIGGAICAFAQILIDKTKLTPARILVLYVVAGVALGGLGIYEPFREFAGAGASVPLLGFGYNLSKGVKEAVDRDGLIGALTGGLSSCSAGIAAALFSGLLSSVIFRSRRRK